MKDVPAEDILRIVVIGGGAGGLELVTKLGERYRKRDDIEVTLVDVNHAHIWKPLLHEIAAGTLNSNDDELSYLAHSHWHHFQFRLGALAGIDRKRKVVSIAGSSDKHGVEYIPPRAQAAHQQARLIEKAISARLNKRPLPHYQYQDFGSLINLSSHSTIGNLMGNLFGRQAGSIAIEGWFARLAYVSLYKMHQIAVNGVVRTLMLSAANMLTRRHKPRLKLH